MSRRRSPSHLALVALGSGLITLAVAITRITPVWLAIGPLLLVILDTIVYSPTIRGRVRRLARAVTPEVSPPRLTPRLPEPEMARASFAYRRSPFLPLLSGLVAALGIAAAVQFLPAHLWLILVGVIGLLGLLWVFSRRFVGNYELETSLYAPSIRFRSGLGLGPPQTVAAWLAGHISHTGDEPLSVVVVSFEGPVPVGELAGRVASIARAGGHIHSLSVDEFLIVGDRHDVKEALSLFGLGWLNIRPTGEPPSTGLLVGEAEYPRDGSTPDELIAKARQKQGRPTL